MLRQPWGCCLLWLFIVPLQEALFHSGRMSAQSITRWEFSGLKFRTQSSVAYMARRGVSSFTARLFTSVTFENAQEAARSQGLIASRPLTEMNDCPSWVKPEIISQEWLTPGKTHHTLKKVYFSQFPVWTANPQHRSRASHLIQAAINRDVTLLPFFFCIVC